MSPVPAPRPGEYPHHYEAYIAAVPAGDLLDHLEDQQERIARILDQVPEKLEDHRYAPDKWSLKEVFAHVLDTERILSYRLLCIARGEEAPLPGFDQDGYVAAGELAHRSLASLVEEFQVQRAATHTLIANLPASAWGRLGTANHHLMSAAAVAHVIWAHAEHHVDILRSRYWPD